VIPDFVIEDRKTRQHFKTLQRRNESLQEFELNVGRLRKVELIWTFVTKMEASLL